MCTPLRIPKPDSRIKECLRNKHNICRTEDFNSNSFSFQSLYILYIQKAILKCHDCKTKLLSCKD